MLGASGALARQITGVPGAPSAAMTISGGQLPAPPQKFGGKIERTTPGSKPHGSTRFVPTILEGSGIKQSPMEGVSMMSALTTVDGKVVATQKMEDTLPFLLPFVASLDIGSETRTDMNDADSQSPFKFTGKLNEVTLTIDRPKLSPEDIKNLEESQRKKSKRLSSRIFRLSGSEALPSRFDDGMLFPLLRFVCKTN